MRKSKYDTHVAPFIKEIGQMARNGAPEEEIAKKLGVAYSTFRGYKAKHEKLAEALRITKELADLDVEAALWNKAKGFKVPVRRVFKVKESYYDDRGKKVEKEKLETAEEDFYVQPDTRAIEFYLKNKRRGEYRDSWEYNTAADDEGIKSFLEAVKPGEEDMIEIFGAEDRNDEAKECSEV